MGGFRLRQGGEIVAEVSGDDRDQCLREIMHYALVYSQDGRCSIEGVTDDDWAALKAHIAGMIAE